MKISILSSSLSNNAFGRAYILAKVLKRHYDIEIIGPTYGKEIWPPCDTGEFNVKPFQELMPKDLFSLKRILNLIQGDVIYAVKPLLASYGVALAKRLRTGTPVVLDIDDWQLAYTTQMEGRFDIKRLRARISGLRRSPNSYYWVSLMEKSIRWANHLTTVSSFLKDKYGQRAVIVPHGRDDSLFNPDLYDRESLRRERGLDQRKIVMFLGTPKPHKGIEDLVLSVKKLRRPDTKVMIVGVEEDDPFIRALPIDRDLIVPIGMVPFHEIPKFLSMADLVALPQRREPKTAGQIPAKLIDAMAMAKPIVATNVSDIAEILNGCGIVVEPGEIERLASRIDWLLENKDQALELGRKAREQFLKSYSFSFMESQLLRVFDNYLRHH